MSMPTTDQSFTYTAPARPGAGRIPSFLAGTHGLPVTVYYSTIKRQLYLGTTTNLYLLNCSNHVCEGSVMPEVKGPVVRLLATGDGAVGRNVGQWRLSL